MVLAALNYLRVQSNNLLERVSLPLSYFCGTLMKNLFEYYRIVPIVRYVLPSCYLSYGGKRTLFVLRPKTGD
jgi:hypothetical protein